ncbi:MAG: hypothetical protein KDE47_28585 [Caldilineaceae bacterium]|nr:hypothetical protein [Caldilineaceae bacterium]
MTTSTVNVPVTYELYQRLKQAARWQDKSVETVLSETLDSVLPAQESVPSAMSQEMNKLASLPTEVLLQVAREVMSDADQAAIEQLVDWQSIRVLTDAEQQRLASLQVEYERILLRKARAFALLAERGQPQF